MRCFLALGIVGAYNIHSLFSTCAMHRTANPHSAGWSSLVARRAHNPKVVGSNPAPATKIKSLTCENGQGFFIAGEFGGNVLGMSRGLRCYAAPAGGIGNPTRVAATGP